MSLRGCPYNHALAYAKEFEQFGQSIANFQDVRWKIPEMAEELEVFRSLTYRAALEAEARGCVLECLETSNAKLYSGKMAEIVMTDVLQAFGSTGYQPGHPLKYLYRLQRSCLIAAGTDRSIKNNVADQIIEAAFPALA